MGYFIGENCSTCHYCYNECPVHAIGFVGSEYAIDQEKCTGCGKCVEVCPSGIITNTDDKSQKMKHNLIYLTCDLVVIGGGGAGLVAATKFAQLTGKSVILLEKALKCGGNTTLSHGFIKSAKYSKFHKEKGLPDGREDFIRNLYERTGKKLDYQLVHDAQYAICDMVDFLFGFGGWENYFTLETLNMGPDAGETIIGFPNRALDNLKSTDHSMGPGWMSTFAVRKLVEVAPSLGVNILTGHRALKLLTGDKGEIIGVIADDSRGRTIINAGCCVLATGGFSRSEEKMKKVRPTFNEGYPVHSFTVASNTGDGIDMVEDIDGAIDYNQVRIPMFGPTHHPFHYGVVRLVEQPEIVRVDKNGKRFQNEAVRNTGLTSVMESLPEHYGWAIMDSNTSAIMGRHLIESANDPAIRYGYVTWKEQLEEETTYDLAAKKAGTLEELAKMIRVDPQTLLSEINVYNESCIIGIDKNFGKPAQCLVPIIKPPFYAAFIARFNETTMGGIVNDTNLNVVRKDGTPVKGLYTAGDCCRGLVVDDYMNKFGDCAWAMASGYLCAEHAASYMEGK